MSSTSPYPDFDRLSPILYLYTPLPHHNPSSSTCTTDPDLIILATWMQALPKVINTYITSYRQHYPTSRILLITSSFSEIFFISAATYNTLLRPALPILVSLNGNLVAATYSNAGAIALTSLASLYATTTGRPLPLHAHILDSAPGSGSDLLSAERAISAAFPPFLRRGLARYLVRVLLMSLLGGLWTALRALRRLDVITAMRRVLLDGRIIQKGGKRAYILGKGDEMVNFNAVLLHAYESGVRGWKVRKELWEGSGHCSHAKADPERYWRVVRETLK